MIKRVSGKGQVVLPSRIRRKLGLKAGDSLEATVEGQHIVLTQDPVTGLPVLTAGPKAPKLTSAEVREILSDFP